MKEVRDIKMIDLLIMVGFWIAFIVANEWHYPMLANLVLWWYWLHAVVYILFMFTDKKVKFTYSEGRFQLMLMEVMITACLLAFYGEYCLATLWICSLPAHNYIFNYKEALNED